MDDIKATISKNITELRMQAHLTQLQLAEMLNYSDKAVSKWERAVSSPDISLLIPLAEVLGVSTGELLGGEKAEERTEGRERNGISVSKRTRPLTGLGDFPKIVRATGKVQHPLRRGILE